MSLIPHGHVTTSLRNVCNSRPDVTQLFLSSTPHHTLLKSAPFKQFTQCRNLSGSSRQSYGIDGLTKLKEKCIWFFVRYLEMFYVNDSFNTFYLLFYGIWTSVKNKQIKINSFHHWATLHFSRFRERDVAPW